MPASTAPADRLVSLDVRRSVWDRFFTVHPLVVVGSREADGAYDLAPRHMVTPVGWGNYFGFVCARRHHTLANVRATGVFTITFPRPSQVTLASLAASGREETDVKPILNALPTLPARVVDGRFLADGYIFLECEVVRIDDGFDDTALVIGRIVAAHVDEQALRTHGRDDGDLLWEAPLLAYLHPGRFARIQKTTAFPYPARFQR